MPASFLHARPLPSARSRAALLALVAAGALATPATAQSSPARTGVPARQGLAGARFGPPHVSVAATASERALLGEGPFLEGQVLVRFADGVSLSDAFASVTNERYVVDCELLGICDLYRVAILDGTPVARAVSELSRLETIRYVVPDHLTSLRGIPDDPGFASQWALDNRGQTGGTADADIDAPEAWTLGTGSRDFVIAIVDGGIDLAHPELVPNLWVNAAERDGLPGVDDDGDGYIDDVHGWNAYSSSGDLPVSLHGTHVAGIAGASGNDGRGVAGVNWEVTLLPIAGSTGVTSVVLEAYGYAADLKDLWLRTGGAAGANVVATNSSFGIDFADCSQPAYQAWNDAYEAMGMMGILSAAATANRNVDVDADGDVPTTCASPYLVTVTNTTADDRRNASAAYGAVSIDLGAPGTDILSTVSGGGTSSLTGTSMASPHVAGAIAFLHSVASPSLAALRAQDPAAAARVVKGLLLSTVDPLPGLEGRTTSGGRLNLHTAALAAHEWGSGSRVEPYGSDHGGANQGTLSSASPALGGAAFVFDVGGLPAATFGSLRFSTTPAELPFLGGTLLVSLPGTVARVSFPFAAGTAQVPVVLPTGFAGTTFYTQVLALDATQLRGLAFTNGLAITIGI